MTCKIGKSHIAQSITRKRAIIAIYINTTVLCELLWASFSVNVFKRISTKKKKKSYENSFNHLTRTKPFVLNLWYYIFKDSDAVRLTGEKQK